MKPIYGRNHDKLLLDVTFGWSFVPQTEAEIGKYFRIYRSGQFLGCTNSTLYVDKDYEASDEDGTIEYQVKAIGNDGLILATATQLVDLSSYFQ